MIEKTPIAEAPVKVGATEVTTDVDGKFRVELPPDTDASISSGIKAIRYVKINDQEQESLPGTAEQIKQIAEDYTGRIEIDAIRLVNAGPICLNRDANSGAESLWFPYTNASQESLEIPQRPLNELFSATGEPYPPLSFEPTDPTQPESYRVFSWPVQHFISDADMVSAIWRILGTEISVLQLKAEVPLCTQPGELDDCVKLGQDMSSRLFEQTLATISRLGRACEKAKKQGKWRPVGKFRNPYYQQAARSLRAIRQILHRLPATRYTCQGQVPPGCTVVAYPKAQIAMEFDKILRVKLPSGLTHLTKRLPGERRLFLAELAKQPRTFLTCSN